MRARSVKRAIDNPIRRPGLLGAFSLFLAASGGTATSAGAAPAHQAFIATATAQAVRVSYTVPDFLLVETFVDVGGPVGQAVVESSGSSKAFGALPYPGDSVIAAPGLPSAAGQPALPAGYPLYASAEHPVTPSSRVEDPSRQYLLEASADADRALGRARAVVGSEALSTTGTSATAKVEVGPDGVVSSLAETVTEGVSLAGILNLASIRSTAVSRLGPGDIEPTTRTELVIEGATINGTEVTIGPDGVSAAGAGVPVPTDEVTTKVNSLLAGAGIAVRVVQSSGVAGGRSADALEVVVRQKLPVADEAEGTATYRFGGASAWISSGGSLESSIRATPPPASDIEPDGRGIQSPGGGEPRPMPEPGVGAPAPTSRLAADVPSFLVPAPGRGLMLARDLRGSLRSLYLVLAMGGAVLLSSSSIWRTKGVQARWTF